MELTKDVSARLSLLRFPLIAGVVLIHSTDMTLHFETAGAGASQGLLFAAYFRQIAAREFSAICVPLFFVMSGYLFFNGFMFSGETIKRKLGGRVRTLLAPYLLWSLANLLFYDAVQSIGALSPYLSRTNKWVTDYQWADFMMAFVDRGDGFPIAYHFWFVRDLIILVYLSPLLFLLLKRLSREIALALLILWLSALGLFHDMIPSLDAVFFYGLGAAVAIRRSSLAWIDRHGLKICLVYPFIAVAAAYLQLNQDPLTPHLHRVGILLGLMGSWYLGGKALRTETLKHRLLWLSPLSFFVYAAHVPLVDVIQKGVYLVSRPTGSGGIIAIYLGGFALTLAATLAMAQGLRKAAPRFYGLLTGGR